MKLSRLVLVSAAAAIATLVFASEKKKTTAATGHQVLDAANLHWGDPPPGLPASAKVAVLAGDPGQADVFTVRMRVPAGCKILPHTHPTAEYITVLSGSLHIGTGAQFDEANSHVMAAGSFMAMPANTQHFAWAKEETVIQIHAEGPFVIKYLNPADDPRGAQK